MLHRILQNRNVLFLQTYKHLKTAKLATKVAMMMSGGIDSSVAAMLLKRQGFDVIGVFMRNWNRADEHGVELCPVERDYQDMKQVCDKLSIPAHQVEFAKEYWNNVFDPFLKSYQTGYETPNPDTMCNRHIKFEAFREYASKQLATDYIATGHYAQITHFSTSNLQHPSVSILQRGVDAMKDQSYFLSTTPSGLLHNTLFPIGRYTKQQVRTIAMSSDSPLRDTNVIHKKESVGVCFIGERNMKAFLTSYFNPTPGRFVDVDTRDVVGSHKGVELYTVGEKAKIGGMLEKCYIVGRAKPPTTVVTANGGLSGSDSDSGSHESSCTDVFVGMGRDHPALYSDYLLVEGCNMSWMSASIVRELFKHKSVFCPIDIQNHVLRSITETEKRTGRINDDNFDNVSKSTTAADNKSTSALSSMLLNIAANTMTTTPSSVSAAAAAEATAVHLKDLCQLPLFVQYKHQGEIALCQLEFNLLTTSSTTTRLSYDGGDDYNKANTRAVPAKQEHLPITSNKDIATASVLEEINYEIKVTFMSPQKAVSPGQVSAFYLGYFCVGGGKIRETSFNKSYGL